MTVAQLIEVLNKVENKGAEVWMMTDEFATTAGSAYVNADGDFVIDEAE